MIILMSIIVPANMADEIIIVDLFIPFISLKKKTLNYFNLYIDSD